MTSQLSDVSVARPSLLEQLRWQVPYAALCYAYASVTLAKRVVLRGRAGLRGEEIEARRFMDKWGFLSSAVSGACDHPVWMGLCSEGKVVIARSLLRALRTTTGSYVFSTVPARRESNGS